MSKFTVYQLKSLQITLSRRIHVTSALRSGSVTTSGGKDEPPFPKPPPSKKTFKKRARSKPEMKHWKGSLPQLSERDCFRRVEFSSQMLSMMEKDPDFLDRIIFSDEGNFWPMPSPKAYNPKERKHAESVPLPTIVWAGMTTKEVIGPYFFNSHLTDRTYLTMLTKWFVPELKRRSLLTPQIWFQQDGTHPHRTGKVLAFLRETFEDRIISLKVPPIIWPPRSQDLTPLDYFLWDHLKKEIATKHQPTTKEALRDSIAIEMEQMSPKLLKKTLGQLPERLEKCIEANGKRFKYEK